MQVSISSHDSPCQASGYNKFTTRLEAFQLQMNTLRQNLNKGVPSTSSQNQINSILVFFKIAGTTFSLSSIKHIPDNVWILDTSATSHMCCNKNFMHNVHSLDTPLAVKFPDSFYSYTYRISFHTSYFCTYYRRSTHFFFHFNLLSISKLSTQLHLDVYFTPNECYVQDQMQKKTLVLSNTIGGLYQLVNQLYSPLCQSTFSIAEATFVFTWHI